MNNVTLKQLRAFVVVAEKSSFVSAARALNLSQPALSQTIRQLEDQVGSPLFHRTTRSVRLTPLGASFLPQVTHLLRQFESVIGEAREVASQKQGRVAIACLPSVASRLMPRVVAVNERLFPGIRVIIRDTNMRGVITAVTSGEVDLGIGGSVADHGELESVVVARDHMHALVPITSALARRRTLKWADLADQPFVAMSHETGVRELVDAAAGQQGIKLRVVAEVSNMATLTGMIEEGIGVSALPGLVLPRSDHSFIRHRLLTDPQVQRTIRLFWRGSVGLSPAAQAIMQSLRHCIAEDHTVSTMPHIEWQAAAIEALALPATR